jgi:hypothetical protein
LNRRPLGPEPGALLQKRPHHGGESQRLQPEQRIKESRGLLQLLSFAAG